MEALGRHILVEYSGCPAHHLDDASHIEAIMLQAAEAAGATVINTTFHHFSPFGVSGVVVVQESHLAIHTWPEFGYAAVDIFACGTAIDTWAAYEVLHTGLGARTGASMELLRGQRRLLTQTQPRRTTTRDPRPAPPPPERDVWLTERNGDIALSLRHRGRQLFKARSDHQLIEVYDTCAYGKALTLDKMVMTTEGDEFAYHEMLTHPAMLCGLPTSRILIIGGGDGGAAREVLRHDHIERLTLVEIDPLVIEVSRQHLPTLSTALDHPRLDLIIGDGADYVAKAPPESFDLIIVDSTDPVGPAEGLATEAFYRNLHRLLTPIGRTVVPTESPFFNSDTMAASFRRLQTIFGTETTHAYLASIPTYPSGLWSFTLAFKQPHHPWRDIDTDAATAFCAHHGLRYYSPEVHRAAFALPPFVKAIIGG